jgi:SHS2 domain-containing protein
MSNPQPAGFLEITHTADWALKVWAADLPGLFVQAARGMYFLMEIGMTSQPRVHRVLELAADDAEGLLVSFLGELLYYLEQEKLAFDSILVSMDNLLLHAELEGSFITAQSKEIKAVTYHNLAIQKTGSGLEVTIVLDI